MNTLNVQLPDSIHKGLKDIAQREGISVNQFIATAVAEKLAIFMSDEYLQIRAQFGNRAAYDAALAQVPDVDPEEHDKIA